MSLARDQTSAHPQCSAVFQNIQPHGSHLDHFRKSHAGWLEEKAKAGPIYQLPAAAIASLEQAVGAGGRILTDAGAEVEREFLQLCDRCNVTAYWNGQFVHVPYLRPIKPLSISKEQARQLGWSPAQARRAEQLSKKGDTVETRLKGYAGWLATEPAFLQARDELARRWRLLPEDSRPVALDRSIELPALPNRAEAVSEEVAQFQKDLNNFLDRWGLTRMHTWDLAAPQGPWFAAPFAHTDGPAMPKQGLHLVLPIHYPLTGTDDLLHDIRRQQIQLAGQIGLDPTVAGLPH